ncbi:MAG: DUF4430 domain-containing protein [Peptococcaceae bacterium]|jgi:hypothetical protein|nr:DUF4430 domain-containing protein [Peptococcaceae bacterium]
MITALVILTALVAAWFYGGNFPDQSSLTAEAASRRWEFSMDEGASLQVASSQDASVRGASLQDASLTSLDNAVSPLYADDASSAMEIDPKTGKDRYLTDPVPEGMPTPMEPQDATVGDDSFTVMLTVRCDTILDNMKYLDKEKHELVPPDGLVFPLAEVTAYEGESVFNILHREMKQARIHMTFRNTPIYNSAYIEAINNLYEFDAGELSGWMYAVNGWYPNYGCSRYTLKPGDVVEWNYTCDLGRDLGQYWVTGFQEE